MFGNTLEYYTESIFNQFFFSSSFLASNFLNKNNITAVIGAYSETYVQAACFQRVPYIVTSGVPNDVVESPFLLNIQPGIPTFALAINDIVTYFGWKRVAVVYDWEEGMIDITVISSFIYY